MHVGRIPSLDYLLSIAVGYYSTNSGGKQLFQLTNYLHPPFRKEGIEEMLTVHSRKLFEGKSMVKHRNDSSQEQAQGVALIELVIQKVQADPQIIAGFCGDYPLVSPQPLSAEVLAHLTFPNGKPLPPSLKRWLTFDYTWLAGLGWLDPSTPALFTPRSADEIVEAEFEGWGVFYAPAGERFDTCFLLPEGSDSRRIYAVTEQDPLGEYPVLVVDTDDMPYTAIMYPGFDVYMADLAGVISHPMDTYTDLFNDPRYASRLQWHADQLFDGHPDTESLEFGEDDEGNEKEEDAE